MNTGETKEKVKKTVREDLQNKVRKEKRQIHEECLEKKTLFMYIDM
jgi:hypothetical protein